jgi:hypothetical protein
VECFTDEDGTPRRANIHCTGKRRVGLQVSHLNVFGPEWPLVLNSDADYDAEREMGEGGGLWYDELLLSV